MQKQIIGLCVGILLFGGSVMAQLPDTATRIACFDALKSQVLEVADFRAAAQELETLDYAVVNRDMSRYYANQSSFGIDLDQPLFDMRIYSFGRETGYVHPPYSPFPSSTGSERWEAPAKEFILAEEYVRTPEGEREFLGCGFFRIASTDLAGVTAENYLYDGPLSSLLAVGDPKNLYWYNFNASYDQSDELMAYWYRLFVYPSATQNNEYFNRYDIATAFPGHQMADLSLLTPAGISERRAESGEFPELEPVEVEKAFFLDDYYQAIVDVFPDFAERLALRGFFEYENLQKVLASPNNENLDYLWETVLDARPITKYAMAKERGEQVAPIEFYEQVLRNPDRLNRSAVNALGEEATESVKIVAKDASSGNTSKVVSAVPNLFMVVVGLLVLLLFMIGLVIYFTQKRK